MDTLYIHFYWSIISNIDFYFYLQFFIYQKKAEKKRKKESYLHIRSNSYFSRYNIKDTFGHRFLKQNLINNVCSNNLPLFGKYIWQITKFSKY